ncbi:5'-AMP-activated protein kinase beta subunit, interation domain-containing protein [Trichoderma compactum]
MYMMRPPRLPLPIEEEVHTPGSPILGPDESLADLELGESSEALTRKSSALSSGTAEDDEGEELRVDKTRPVVATRIEWKGGGEKIWVTGTIFHWNRKLRLRPVEGQPGVFAATIHVLPGTHHIRFLVDGIMQTSPELPTTVDFGNNLVNYIEVNPDDALATKKGQVVEAAEAGKEKNESQADSESKEEPKVARRKPVLPQEAYNGQIPQYLLDFDQAEESPAYRNAVSAIEKLTTPPSLPGFLGKPILNAATLMKDDNSVLNMPNHTVLNHLATSSIKNNVLAVSATTRYHNKYVTTIIYKPTSTDEG